VTLVERAGDLGVGGRLERDIAVRAAGDGGLAAGAGDEEGGDVALDQRLAGTADLEQGIVLLEGCDVLLDNKRALGTFRL
jgi:hypothetical protein